jgi:hypothetical protein
VSRQVRRRGSFAPLSASYYKDDALDEAGLEAELLFVRGLAFCAETLSDGVITARQVVRFVGVGMTDPLDLAARLVKVDVWREVPGGFLVRSWLDWNSSRDEIRGAQEKDRDRKRRSAPSARPQPPTPPGPGTPVDGSPAGFRAESDRKPDGVQPDSTGSRTGKVVVDVEVEVNPSRGGAPRRATRKRATTPEPEPAMFEVPPVVDAEIVDPPPATENAATLVAEWIEHCAIRPPGNVVGQTSKQIKSLLGEGIPYPVVRAGLAEWARKGAHPAAIPSFVNQVANSRPAQPGRHLAPVADPTANGGLGTGTAAERANAFLSLRGTRGPNGERLEGRGTA